MNKKTEVVRLLKDGHSYSEVSSITGLSKATISYHAKNSGLSKFKKKTYDWARVQEFYSQGYTVKQCVDKFGFSPASWTKAAKRGLVSGRSSAIPYEEILIIGSKTNRCNLRKRLIKDGLLKNVCSICLCRPVHNNKPLTLQLDHINGVNNDNRLNNLRLLCPNCHSQTETFGGKNKK